MGAHASASSRQKAKRAKQNTDMNISVIESYHISLYIGMK
jgi:hypothetical protein